MTELTAADQVAAEIMTYGAFDDSEAIAQGLELIDGPFIVSRLRGWVPGLRAVTLPGGFPPTIRLERPSGVEVLVFAVELEEEPEQDNPAGEPGDWAEPDGYQVTGWTYTLYEFDNQAGEEYPTLTDGGPLANAADVQVLADTLVGWLNA